MEDVHALTGAYALDALDADERRFAARHLESCAQCAAEVEELRETAALLGAAAAERPPDTLRAAVLDAAGRTPQVGSTAQPQPPWLLAAAAALIVALLTAGTVLVLVRPAGDSDLVALLAAPDAAVVELDAPAGVAARLVVSEARNEAVLVTDGLAEAPADGAYVLWLLRGDRPTPAGSFRAEDGPAHVRLAGDVGTADAVGVTLEPDPDVDSPTGPILISGAV